MTLPTRKKRRLTAREGAALTGVTPRHVRRLVALPRDEWLAQMAVEREAIRAYHDDQGHSWTETAAHFKLHVGTVKQRAYRACIERTVSFKK